MENLNNKRILDLSQYQTAKKYGGETAYKQAKANGETGLNYRQWVQVRTPEFKAWFGDWENDPESASKIINPKTGEPLVMYHGTGADFTVFDKSANNQRQYDRKVTGFWFTHDKKIATKYVENSNGQSKNIMSVFLNIRDLSEIKTKSAMLEAIYPDVVDFVNSRNGKDWFGKKFNDNEWQQIFPNNLTDFFKENTDRNGLFKGYSRDAYAIYEAVKEGIIRSEFSVSTIDGIVIKDRSWGVNHFSYVVRDPNQIKFATDNTGAFDRNNPDMR